MISLQFQRVMSKSLDPVKSLKADLTCREDLPAVLLLGLTGSGKSTFISLLAEQNVVVGHSLTSGKLFGTQNYD
jgi:GTP-binding protein EngB required for normal cell division